MSSPSWRVAYVYEADLREAANTAGRNYWYEYVREIMDRLGLTAEPVSRHALTAETLSALSVLLLGDLTTAHVTPGLAARLDRWVADGGVLIGFGTEGLDELFGVQFRSPMPQPGDEFSIAGYLDLRAHPLTEGIHSPLHPEQKLLIISPIRSVRPQASVELARLFSSYQVDTECAAITMREHGAGLAFYFAFNLPQTIWTIQQGRPIDGDYDGDGYYRTSDARVIGTNEPEVLYTDELLLLLQNMLATRRVPLIHQLPPHEGRVPDALFFWGGDDEAAAGTQVWASNWMKSRGLPYHLNLMPQGGRFAVSLEEFRQIQANGHECSLHYNFLDDFKHPNAFTQADVQKQADLYYDTFGERPICSVNHWCCWTGWAEVPRWLAEAGGKADNCRIHRGSPPLNPANRLGFSFGTAFPYYFYDDWRGGNRRIDLLEEPITGYELGYTPGQTDFSVLHRALDLAAYYHLTMNLFYHPVNIFNHEVCRAAIDEVLRYLDERGIVAKHVANDELWRWWSQRSAARLTDVAWAERTLSFTSHSTYPAGLIVKIPLGSAEARSATDAGGQELVVENRPEWGQNWAFIVVPPGDRKVQVEVG